MLVTASQMKAAEERAFREGSSPESLMNEAAAGLAASIRQFFPEPQTAVVYCGKGNNAGDALLAAVHLLSSGWRVLVRCAAPLGEMTPLARKPLEKLPSSVIVGEVPEIRGELLLIDGLLGIGVTGAPRGLVADLIMEMNRIRMDQGAFSVSADLPSGLEATTGEVFTPCVEADLTVTFGAVKTGLVADGATRVTGRLALVSLPALSYGEGDPATVATAVGLRRLLPLRNFDTFKGNYGRIGILAGSPGFLGAARIASAAAVHAGGGLVTLYALPECYGELASSCLPEVMVRPVSSWEAVLAERNDVLALGPGLGREHDAQVRGIVERAPIPCVVDADALNAVSTEPTLLRHCAAPRLLTPHPGELERLFPCEGRSRRSWAEEFVQAYPTTLLLKGARSLVAERNAAPSFNTTGNPGMGSGGMGDALTGVCAALIGSGRSPREAALLGAWICGRAAEIAVFNGGESQESLSASSVIGNIGGAFRSLRNGDY